MRYIANIHKKDGVYSVEFYDVPGCITFGATLDEAKKRAKNALDGTLAVMLAHNKPLPESTLAECEKNGLYAINVDTQLATAYIVFEARRGKTATEMSRKMGISRQAYQRFENPKTNMSIMSLDKIAQANGKKLEIRFV